VFTSSDSNAVLPIDYTEILPTETHTFYANEPSDGNGFNWLIVVNDASQDAKCETGVEEIEVS
jgi:hypothetical protein